MHHAVIHHFRRPMDPCDWHLPNVARAGVEMGGALKNVLAIACGISDGLGFGNNGRAALITRGLAEMTRLVRFPVSVATLLGSDGYCNIVHARRAHAVVTCHMSYPIG